VQAEEHLELLTRRRLPKLLLFGTHAPSACDGAFVSPQLQSITRLEPGIAILRSPLRATMVK